MHDQIHKLSLSAHIDASFRAVKQYTKADFSPLKILVWFYLHDNKAANQEALFFAVPSCNFTGQSPEWGGNRFSYKLFFFYYKRNEKFCKFMFSSDKIHRSVFFIRKAGKNVTRNRSELSKYVWQTKITVIVRNIDGWKWGIEFSFFRYQPFRTHTEWWIYIKNNITKLKQCFSMIYTTKLYEPKCYSASKLSERRAQ